MTFVSSLFYRTGRINLPKKPRTTAPALFPFRVNLQNINILYHFLCVLKIFSKQDCLIISA